MSSDYEELSLALDPDGYANIAYEDTNTFYLKFAYQDISGWHIQTVYQGQIWSGRHPSLVMDAQGYAHISHGGGDSEYSLDFYYTHQSASGWSTQLLESQGVEGWFSSIVLKTDGYPCVSFFSGALNDDEWQGDLKYGCNSSSGWSFETVYRGGKV